LVLVFFEFYKTHARVKSVIAYLQFALWKWYPEMHWISQTIIMSILNKQKLVVNIKETSFNYN
jgi:hypothetical protein